MKRFRRIAALLFATTLLFPATPLFAASEMTTLDVTASVPADCIISVTTDVAFGTYNPLLGGNKDATGVLSVQCVQGTTITTIDLDYGANASGSTRRMYGGGSIGNNDYIVYELYKPSASTPDAACAYTTAWVANFTPNPAQVVDYTARTYNICGRAVQNQDVEVGSYSDTVTVTINY